LVDTRFPEIAEQIGLTNIAEDRDEPFTFRLKETLELDGITRELHLQQEHADGRRELVKLVRLDITGQAAIRVGEVPLAHKRLGDARVAYGGGTLDGKQVVIVVSDSQAGSKASLRLRSPDGEAVTAGLRPVAPRNSGPAAPDSENDGRSGTA
jgi:hypothetical protein